MPLPIQTADQRANRPRSTSGVILGEAGAGKTWQLHTLNPEKTLFLNLEAGDLSVQDVKVDMLNLGNWQTCQKLACLIGGANSSSPPDSPYSQASYDAVIGAYGADTLDKYDTIFIDSITEAARLCLSHCKQLPIAKSAKTGNEDGYAVYGALGNELIAWFKQLHRSSKNVWLVGILEQEKDDNKRIYWQAQIEGSKAQREIYGIFDEVLTLTFDPNSMPEPGKELERVFICQKGNPYGYPAKDRSGRLNMQEPADLGAVMRKIISKPETKPTTGD